MTVAELIEALQKMPQNAVVRYCGSPPNYQHNTFDNEIRDVLDETNNKHKCVELDNWPPEAELFNQNKRKQS